VNVSDDAIHGSRFSGVPTPRIAEGEKVNGESRSQSRSHPVKAARPPLWVAVFVLALGCPKQAGPSPDLTKRFAGGNVLTLGGPKKYAGSPVQVEVSFKDGSPNCTMNGAVQFARDDTHRWVWLEPTEGCPEWLTGRWWAELASGGAGWYVQDISTQAVEDKR
jgi:hypothetical protein